MSPAAAAGRTCRGPSQWTLTVNSASQTTLWDLFLRTISSAHPIYARDNGVGDISFKKGKPSVYFVTFYRIIKNYQIKPPSPQHLI